MTIFYKIGWTLRNINYLAIIYIFLLTIKSIKTFTINSSPYTPIITTYETGLHTRGNMCVNGHYNVKCIQKKSELSFLLFCCILNQVKNSRTKNEIFVLS